MEQVDIKRMLTWVSEAQISSSQWRRDSWEDFEFRDGKHWTAADYHDMIHVKGINPLTLNRIFPILNLIQGKFIRTQQDIIAKGRTKQDTELGLLMSESLAYVRDQNKGREAINSCFNSQITAGFGYMEVGKHYDPRQEPVMWRQRPWYSLWWDPYASPWLDKETCRYAFTMEWTHIDNLLVLFWDKKAEIMDKFAQLSSDAYTPDVYDIGSEVEIQKQYLSAGQWCSSGKKRIRPVEMWYTTLAKSLFAIMPDSRVIDLDTLKDRREEIAVAKACVELIPAVVKKMRVATFVSDLLLQDIPCPYAHDNYPFVPFVGYMDRFNCPFGVPRQIKEQSMEVNKRRSMALALISSRRTYIEEEAVKDLNKAYKEVNRHNGMVVLRKGKLEKIKVDENADLATGQIELMRQSEREIQEIVGATDEALQTTSYLQSAVGLDKKQEITNTVLASLFENSTYSQMRLAELTMSLIQTEWKGPKVLRITDRLSGADKFVAINERIATENGVIEIKNNLSEARFDLVPAQAPMTDTMREKHIELLFNAINKATPEMVGPILNVAFELADFYEKDILLRQIRRATGYDPSMDDMPEEEQIAIAKAEKSQQAAAQAQVAAQDARLKESEIEKNIAAATKQRAEAVKADKDTQRADWEAGIKLGQELRKAMTGEEGTA
jgi:hypothetical protein